MAEAPVSKLQHDKVKRYFRDKLEANTRLVDSLRRKQLINDDERDKISQGSESKKANTCYEILVQKVTDDKIPILNTILHENGLQRVEEMLIGETSEQDLDISLGNTHLLTLFPSNEGSINRIMETTVDEYSAVIEESNIEIYDMQFGCIHLFLHSKEPFYQELCEEKNCRIYIEKCLSLKNVEATLKPNQTIKIVITKNPYSLPLKDGKGKSLEFSKKLVIKINRYVINSEINPCTQILARLETITGRLEPSQNKLADILLILMEKDPDKVWKTLIYSLRELNIVTIADRLEKMTCAECYRRTIICDFKNILDEIDTDLMEETFEGKPYIPEVVLKDCILSKGKLPRVERAKYFLEYVLLKGEVLLSFADALSSRSNVVLNFSPCEVHGGESLDTSSSEPDKEFTFLVCKDEKDKFYLKRFQTPSEGEILSSDRLHDGSNGVKGGNGVHIDMKNHLKRNEQTDSEGMISLKKEKIHEHDEPNEIIKGAQA
ncbi:uncharacterized protein [Mytilus edulis]|uniref:uncharacterized protein n=1 Tax=Mytilus edulis TaxID=6550 RepID=UPI0039F09AA1